MAFKDGRPDISPKQDHLLKICRRKNKLKKVVLTSGVRKSGKTVGCMHAIADHLWNTKSGSVLILSMTQGAAATSGVWNELTEKVLPEWIGADFGMSWSTKGEPRIHGATKKMMCSVINKFGYEALKKGEPLPPEGISKLELDSLDDEREVEKKYKSRYYSMVYWSEATEFKDDLSFSTLLMALRGFELQDDDYVFLIDCNPAENGTEHFLYKKFYELRIADPADVDEDERVLQQCLHLTEWTMDDNPYLSDNEKALIRGIYKKNPSLWSRYIEGKWVKVVEKGLFTKQFSLAIHTVGDPMEQDPDILIPMDSCSELTSTHDAGGVNPVTYLYEKCILHTDRGDLSYFRILDELAFIGEPISVEEFTLLEVDKMLFWEKIVNGPIAWTSWADSSALDVTESIADRTVAAEMYAVSRGKIELRGVDKGRGSVGNRIRLLRKLLTQNRIIISRTKCPKLVEMLESINSGKAPDTIPKGSPHKHPLDALTYGLSKDCWTELQDDIIGLRSASKESEAKLVCIPL